MHLWPEVGTTRVLEISAATARRGTSQFFAAIAWIFLGRKHHDEFGMLEESLIYFFFQKYP